MTGRHYCPVCVGELVFEPHGAPLHCKNCGWSLISLAAWKELPPYQQGYVRYMQAAWPTSPLANVRNPYGEGTRSWTEFRDGEQRAVMLAQDGEE